MKWDFKLFRPGTYEIVAVTAAPFRNAGLDAGHQVTVEVAGQRLPGAISQAEEFVDPSNPRMRYYNSRLGRVTLSKAGAYQLALKPQSIDSRRKGGLSLASIKLVPAK
jgi:hypothetical protein